jgi:response regulator of citrate/malate metabolism
MYFGICWFKIASPLTNHRKTMNIETFSQMKALVQASTEGNQHLIDHFLEGEQGDELRAELKLKRIQFDTHAGLADKLEEVCNLLDCSKRVFLEMAVIEAVQKAMDTFFKTYKAEAGCEFGTRVGIDSDGNEVEVTK